MLTKPGLPSVSHFRLAAHPVHSMGSPSLPRPRFAHTMRSGAGLSHLLSIAYDYNVLGLGPDSPWVDWRSTASVRCLSLATLSVHAHSTSELLRTLSMMAASKPTSWLSWRTHSL